MLAMEIDKKAAHLDDVIVYFRDLYNDGNAFASGISFIQRMEMTPEINANYTGHIWTLPSSGAAPAASEGPAQPPGDANEGPSLRADESHKAEWMRAQYGKYFEKFATFKA